MSWVRRTRRDRTCAIGQASLEGLEPRVVLSSGFSWMPEEVLLAELVNRARMDPFGEGQRVGVDLTEGLTSEELARLIAHEPLALNADLTSAARLHNLDMAQRRFFAHDNPDGDDPSDRAMDAGYSAGAGENIAAGQADVYEAHVAWLESLGHRLNVLSLHDNFTSAFHYNELGVGVLGQAPDAEYRSYYGQLFGVANNGPYVLGVVINDGDGDDFYDIGEGLGGVLVEVRSSAGGEVLGSYTTDSAGNYQIALPSSGSYVVTFTNLTSGLAKIAAFDVSMDNVKIDADISELVDRPPVNAKINAATAPTSSFAPNGTLIVGLVNEDGDAIIARRPRGGAWIADNVTSRTNSALPLGDIHTFYDSKDGRIYALAPTFSGLTLYTLANGTWSARDLSGELGAGVLLPELTVFTGLDNRIRVAGLNLESELVLFEQTKQTTEDNAGFVWTLKNLSTQDLADGGQLTPRFQGELISYVTPWGGLNIAGLDTSGQIQTVWWSAGLERWRTDNLSAITGAPTISGGLTVNQTSWSGINLVGIDEAGRVQVTWWVPSFGGDWRTDDLTSNAGSATTLLATGTSSFTTSWDGINIAGLDEDGNVAVYWWAPGRTGWSVAPLSESIDGAESARGAIRGGASRQGELSLVSSTDDGDLMHIFWNPGDAWAMENITALVG